MNCNDLAQHITKGGTSSSEVMEHLGQCKSCMKEHGVQCLLPIHLSKEGQESEVALGEASFLASLANLGKLQDNSIHRAQTVHQKVQIGDRFFWRGEYEKALHEYQASLMLVEDVQGRVALMNKIARAQMHRHRIKEGMKQLNDALQVLEEPAPPKSSQLHSAIWTEQFIVLAMVLFGWLQKHFSFLASKKIEYGERSLAAQHLYRELSILSQGEDESVRRWAQLKELRWALRIGKPLELVVSLGRYAVEQVQQGKKKLPLLLANQMSHLAQDADPIAQAASEFYLGRISHLQGDWTEAKHRFESCLKLCRASRDDFLREACLQHLIRVYRNDGNYEDALRTASQLLSLYHKLGNLPRLSASCRHFALTYAAYGALRQAKAWAFRALKVIEKRELNTTDRMLSLLRCYVLLADLEQRCGQHEVARLYLGEAIRLKKKYNLPAEYFRDGAALLRQLKGTQQPKIQENFSQRFSRWVSRQWALVLGNTSRAEDLRKPAKVQTNEHKVPAEIAYLYQEYNEVKPLDGLRPAIPSSPFAQAFLRGELDREKTPVQEHEADLIASMFPVGAVSSRWGKGSLAKDFNGAITTQFSNGSEAPWGYFFADDIG